MCHYLLVIRLLSSFGMNAFAVEPLQNCEWIKAEIATWTGLLPTVNVDLLKKLSGRPECAFSAAESYQAAFGDKSVAKKESPDLAQ